LSCHFGLLRTRKKFFEIISFHIFHTRSEVNLTYTYSHQTKKAMSEQTTPTDGESFSAIYKKKNGTLILTDTHLSFNSAPSPTTNNEQKPLLIQLTWSEIAKHQVSPASHPKALLRILLKDSTLYKKGLAFQLQTRDDLDRVRVSVSAKLNAVKHQNNRKRPRDEVPSSTPSENQNQDIKSSNEVSNNSFVKFGKDTLAISRAALLASDDALREQHKLLVSGNVVSEEDFWSGHRRTLADEAAKVHGKIMKGAESIMRSNLDLSNNGGKVRLGVEEIRQIFILYPAVHKAYEEKVPLELSEEQFWRKYLESEYFYSDRGRIGSATQNNDKVETSSAYNQQESHAAIAGAEDIFSRYDVELMKERDERENNATTNSISSKKSKIGRDLGIGQFDLLKTFEVERPKLGAIDLHPTTSQNSQTARIVKKYNRHWGLVMNFNQATAGNSLIDMSKPKNNRGHEDDLSAEVNGGNDEEFERLVKFAECPQNEADHRRARGDDEFFALSLRDVDVYSSSNTNDSSSKVQNSELLRRDSSLAAFMTSRMKSHTNSIYDPSSTKSLLERKYAESENSKIAKMGMQCQFPDGRSGQRLLGALTNKIKESTKSEADTMAQVKSLPEQYKREIEKFFLRSSEILRHFYGLLDTDENKKLDKIVDGIRVLYEEIQNLRKSLLDSGEEGIEIVLSLCLSIIKQLDHAVKQRQALKS